MAFKDYYKTLGVPFNTTEVDIRKTFRKLALQYHPDHNIDSVFAETHFREIQEAYAILTDTSRRYLYDREWLLHFPKENAMQLRQYTPESILEEIMALNRMVKSMDIYRTNKASIQLSAKKILSPQHVDLLLFHKKEDINKAIIEEVMSVYSRLGYPHAIKISQVLLKLAASNEQTTTTILRWQQQLKQKSYWDQYYPLAAIAITLFICIMIYFLSR